MDGCLSDEQDDYERSYELKTYEAGIRCCTDSDNSCETIGECPDNATTYDDAVAKCAAVGKSLCTESQLLDDKCCGKGGNCDHFHVWTSSKRFQSKYNFIDL